jgi:Na+-transporting NADH:ubiquinone oxidoreductase subunit NqrB
MALWLSLFPQKLFFTDDNIRQHDIIAQASKGSIRQLLSAFEMGLLNTSPNYT